MKIITFIVTLLISFSLQAQKLTIYTYDSFVSEWGPGPIIQKKFEKDFNVKLEFIAVDSASTLLNKVILEGTSTKADIILGLDMNLLDAANKSNLFDNHNLENIDKKTQLPIIWNKYFAFPTNRKI